MRDKILAFIRENDLIAPGSTLVCAVSGGKDSVCLLHVMLSLQEQLQITVEAAHLNHQLRAEESDRDEAFVKSFCQSLGVPLTVSRADVSGRCKKTGESTEEAARALRYAFFDRLGKPVATAHTQDDNMETVLLNLVRGTALRGLCGIPPRRGNLIRPMLPVSRIEVEQYLTENKLPHVEDSTNASDFALRNRLRHEVLPILKRENPNLGETVFHMSGVLRREDRYLDEQAASLLHSCRIPSGGWSCRALQDAPEVLRARAVRKLLEAWEIAKPSYAHVQALLRLISQTEGSASVTLPGGKTVRRSYDALDLAQERPERFEPVFLAPDCEVQLPAQELRISCRFVKKYEKSMQSYCTFALKYDTIDNIESLCVRPRKTGDAIHLPGGTKRLKKLLIDRKVPSDKRALVPVVADSAGVILVYPLAASSTRQAQPGEAAILIHFAHEKEYIQKEDTQ